MVDGLDAAFEDGGRRGVIRAGVRCVYILHAPLEVCEGGGGAGPAGLGDGGDDGFG